MTARRILLAAALIAAVGGLAASGALDRLRLAALKAELGTWRGQVRESPVMSAVAFAAVYAALTGCSVPVASGLTMLAGALFGHAAGFAVVIVASTAGATLSMLSARYLVGDLVERRFGGRAERFRRELARDGTFYVVSARLVPLFPFWVVNLCFGLTPVRVRDYALGTAVGCTPAMLIFLHAGTELAAVESAADVLSGRVLAALGLMGLLPWAARLVLKRGARDS